MCNRGPKWERICLCRVPTGAAVGAFNASTLDRAFVFKRAKKEYVPLTTDVLHSKQTEFQHARTLLMDEIGMCGQVLTGHTVGRARETFSAGRSFSQPQTAAPSGGLDVFCRGGDLLQLPPVLDTALYDVRAGIGAYRLGWHDYRNITDFFLLDKLFRQDENSDFAKVLGRMRDGTLSEEEQSLFHIDQPGLLVVTCTNKGTLAINFEYTSRQTQIISVKSVLSGAHALPFNHKQAGMLKAISRKLFLAIGMMVKLTVNITPELGISNGSRGIIREIIYPEGGYDSDATPVVIVEFAEYKGPRCSPNLPATWVPIVALKRICDSKHCCRIGLPLQVCKADTTSSLQGATCGEGEPIRRLLIKWSKNDEQRWTNILYVAVCFKS